MQATKIICLGTGGTIAGSAATPHDHVGYRAAQRNMTDLVAEVPGLAALPVIVEQIAQIDSKDMTPSVWWAIAQRCAHWLSTDDVQGIVVTHGTDTLEETAFFLHRVLAADRPVILTGAMRPATALAPDGPQNLLDAVTVARTAGARGVLAVLAGQVHGAQAIAKRHTYRLDAFSSGEAGPIAVVENGQVQLLGQWPNASAANPALLRRAAGRTSWPRVEIVFSHAGAGSGLVDALVAQGVDGLVVAATGNGTVHKDLMEGLLRARDAGVRVVRATRCAEGRVLPHPGDLLPDAGGLPPVKARVALWLDLLAQAEPGGSRT